MEPGRLRQDGTALGRFNGAYLTSYPVPTGAWLSRRMLRGWLESFSTMIDQMLSGGQHPLSRRIYPPDQLDRWLRLWKARGRLLVALEALPTTFCHLDAFRRNLTAGSPDGTVVAIDWEWVGIASVGEELTPLVAGSLAMMGVQAEQAKGLDETSFPAYVEGLRDAGWDGSERMVRLAYTASSALRFGLVWAAWLAVSIDRGEDGVATLTAFYDRPLDEIVGHFEVALPFLLGLGEEALALFDDGVRSEPDILL